MRTLTFFLIFCFIIITGACSTTQTSSLGEPNISKIKFDITEIDENGLIGPPDGKRLIAYIFYIPYSKKLKREVQRIDKSVQFYEKERPDLIVYQCIGEGASPEILLRLSSLNYIREIKPFYAE